MPSDKISDAIKKAAKEKGEDFKKDADIVTSIPKAPEKPPVPAVTKEVPTAGVDPRIVAYHDPQSAVTEQYRTLWTHILSLDTVANLKTMLITSSHPREGKTVTALNLAVVMAKDSKKEILLLDCNLRSPVIHNFLALQNAGSASTQDVVAQFIEPMKGLSDILNNDLPLDTVLFKTNIPNLTVFPVGQVVPNPTELLGSQKMRRLLTKLKEQFGYVILDAPPVIPYADSRVLGPLVDGVILVVQTEKTRREVVWEAGSVLTGVGTKMLGYVLTGVEYHIPEYIYRHL